MKETTFAQEEIEKFRIFNNKMYVPGRDPRKDTWTDEAFYTKGPSGWTTFTQSGFYHCGDVVDTTTALVLRGIPQRYGPLAGFK